MKIEINNDEINEAIKDYVISQGIDVSNSDVAVEFTAGRKKGNSALVTIAPKGSTFTPSVEANTEAKAEEGTDSTLGSESSTSLFDNE